MHDNATVYIANVVRRSFQHTSTAVSKWPAKSSDWYPIENVWEEMVRMVYEDGRQFSTVESLTQAILESWDSISINYKHWHLVSIPKRVIDVI